MPHERSRPGQPLFWITLTALLLVVAVRSLSWPLVHDAAYLSYIAWLLDARHWVPYRDLYSFNMPGTCLFYMALGRITAFHDVGVRVVDLAWLAATSAVVYRFMRPFGYRPAWASCLLIGFSYLGFGAWTSLQRDWLLLLPALTATLISDRLPGSPWRRAFLSGAFVGLAGTFKPHAWGLLAVLLLHELWLRPGARELGLRRSLLVILSAFTGLALVPATFFAGIAWLGGWPDFLRLFSEVVPEYRWIDSAGDIRRGIPSLMHIGRNLLQPAYITPWLLVGAITGAWSGLRRTPDVAGQARIHLLLACAGFFWIYPGVSAKFFWYDSMPAIVYLSLLASLGFQPDAEQELAVDRTMPRLCATFLLATVLPMNVYFAIGGKEDLEFGAVEELSTYLTEHAAEGDRVQIYDVIRGGLANAALRSRLELATPFISCHVFYMPATSPSLRTVRPDFLAALHRAPPRFFLIAEKFTWLPRGPGARPDFEELDTFLAENYGEVFRNASARVLEYRPRQVPSTRPLDGATTPGSPTPER